METVTYDKIRKIVYDKSGIHLREGKESLIHSRVGKRLRALGVKSIPDYLKYLDKDESGEEMIKFLDVISTNVTSFYREPEHFEFMRQVFMDWVNSGQRRFRFWSAACSSGEEPLTMAMTLLNSMLPYDIDAKILATDISTTVLEKSRNGVYPEKKVEGIPKKDKVKYFHKFSENGDTYYKAHSQLQDMIVYKRLNLISSPFPMSGPLDIVFCRNVMIYFDNKVRARLLAEISRLLKPGGILIVGHAESLTGQLCDLKNVKPSVYIKE